MKRSIIIICFCGITILSISAQDPYKPIKWVIRPSVGETFTINKKNFGFITDNLTTYASQTYYWEVLSTTLFYRNWGIEFFVSGNQNKQLKNRFDKFSNRVTEEYSDRYYVTVSSGCEFSENYTPFGGPIDKFSLGPVYKIEKNRTIFLFRSLLGVTSITSDWGSAVLKEKGTNTILDASWTSDKVGKDFFTFNPSFTIGYRIIKEIVLNFDINYWLYNMEFSYNETIINRDTRAGITTNYHYSRLLNEISFGVGFMYIIK